MRDIIPIHKEINADKVNQETQSFPNVFIKKEGKKNSMTNQKRLLTTDLSHLSFFSD